MPSFTIDQAPVPDHPDVIIVNLHGEIDSSVVKEVEEVMAPLVAREDVRAIAFNLSDVTYTNSRGIGMMMNCYGIMKERGRTFVLVGMQEGVKDTLSLVGVAQLIPMFDNIEGFLATLQ